MESTYENSESEEEDEVTFLLRVRPTPSPPARRRRHSIDCRPIQTKDNWDVIIQRREVSSPNSQRREIPSPRRDIQSPPTRDSPPPLPPRNQPSAPPLEDRLPLYPKQPPYYQMNRLSSEFSYSFPNLKYIENNYGNLVPLPPKPVHYYPGYQYPSVVSSPVFEGHYQDNFGDGCNGLVRHRPPKPLPRSSLQKDSLHLAANRRERETMTDLVR